MTKQQPKITKFCKVEECHKPHLGKGYCKMHYSRLWRYGRLERLKPKKIKNAQPCEIEGCNNIARIKKLCGKCYKQEQRMNELYEQETSLFNFETDPEPEPKSELFNLPDGKNCIVKSCTDHLFNGRFCLIHFWQYDGSEKGVMEARNLIRQ